MKGNPVGNHNMSKIAAVTGGVAIQAATKDVKLTPYDIFEDAINAFYASVQKSVGQKHGDIAGHFHENNEAKLHALFMPYIKSEIEGAKG